MEIKKHINKRNVICFFVGFCFAVLLIGLVGHAKGVEMFRLTWDQNTEEDLAGYRVFKRIEGQPYDYERPIWEGAENITPNIDPSLWADEIYYLVVRAFDTSGNESGDSNEVSHIVDNTPPQAPGGCRKLPPE